MTYAIDEATRLNEIEFPEFTTKLITDVFDALISSNIRQTQSYIELLRETGKSLTSFINDTKDDIDGEMILQFLAAVLPAPISDTKNVTALVKGSDGKANLTKEQAVVLNKALALPSEAGEVSNGIAEEGNKNNYDALLEAVAKRVAATNHELLKEMVKQGLLRLVVENGYIETGLTFQTSSTTQIRKTANQYNSQSYSANSRRGTGKITSLFFRTAASTHNRTFNVTTANQLNTSSDKTEINIHGGVRINFKTDYLSLDR